VEAKRAKPAFASQLFEVKLLSHFQLSMLTTRSLLVRMLGFLNCQAFVLKNLNVQLSLWLIRDEGELGRRSRQGGSKYLDKDKLRLIDVLMQLKLVDSAQLVHLQKLSFE